jgi:hypothetical protein
MKKPTKSTRKPVAKARLNTSKTKATSRGKTVARKGIRHHAKRAYHATPKFIHGMVVGGVVGLLVVGFLGASVFHPSSTSADGQCDAHGIGNNVFTNSTNNSAYSIHGNKATVTFDVVGTNCNLPVTMVVWKAPNGTDGKPYSEQTLFFHTSDTFKTGRHQMTGTLPSCYFQVDTVTGTKLTGATGQAYNYSTRQVAFMHGGNQSCTKSPTQPTPPVIIKVCDLISHEIVKIDKADFDKTKYSKDLTNCETTVVTTPPPTTPPVVSVTPASSTLPNTGPGAVFIILGLSILGGYIFHMTHRHRQHKKHTHAAKHHRKPAHRGAH